MGFDIGGLIEVMGGFGATIWRWAHFIGPKGNPGF